MTLPDGCRAEPRIVLLAGEGSSTNIVYHALREALPAHVSLEVLIETPVPRSTLIWRRVRRLGLLPVLGQLLFISIVLPVLRVVDRRRIGEIRDVHHLDDAPLPITTRRIGSVNSDEARSLLTKLSPRVVVVNGTRIIGRKTLASVSAPFVNMHAGITPAYRGVHGGYWALAEGRPDLVGTTVHFVDEGIDTGEVIKQVFFPVTERDSFLTYPLLHTAAGLPVLVRAVLELLEGGKTTREAASEMPSVLRYHPTAWQYLRARLASGVK